MPDNNREFIDNQKLELSNYVKSDDLGVLTFRSNKIWNKYKDILEDGAKDDKKQNAYSFGLALGELVAELSGTSTETEPSRYTDKVLRYGCRNAVNKSLSRADKEFVRGTEDAVEDILKEET